MGPLFDNQTESYVFDPVVMTAFWFVDDDGFLYIIPRENDNFESCIGNEDKELLLNTLSDSQLSDEETMNKHGLTTVQEWQRRFDEQSGYYIA